MKGKLYCSGKSISNRRLTWAEIIVHFAVTGFLSLLIYELSGKYPSVYMLVETASSIVPSLEGRSLISPDPEWAIIYQIACWVGSPFYLIKFWRMCGAVLPMWVLSQRPMRFWMVIVTVSVGVLAIWFFPQTDFLPKDSGESIRLVSGVVTLMKNYHAAFAIVVYSLVLAFSFSLPVAIMAVLIRVKLRSGGHCE